MHGSQAEVDQGKEQGEAEEDASDSEAAGPAQLSEYVVSQSTPAHSLITESWSSQCQERSDPGETEQWSDESAESARCCSSRLIIQVFFFKFFQIWTLFSSDADKYAVDLFYQRVSVSCKDADH